VELLVAGHANVVVVGDDDQSIYKFRAPPSATSWNSSAATRAAARSCCGALPLPGADPGLELSARPVQRPGPPRVPQRNRQATGPERRGDERPVRHLAFATGSEEADWVAREIATRVPRALGPETSRSWSGPTSMRNRCWRSLNLAAIPWRFSGTSGLYARPEIRLLLAFLRSIADLSSSVDLYALAASDGLRPGWAGSDRHRQRGSASKPIGCGT